ncbi:MAG: tryptophan--tRNA ligase [Elusimicrobia bacterium RIFOXYA12_FULL_51_18]|nr:MAG: tryptophan--tRNA ligase [Elusimicrobia bacterium RIFOXYA12_FULL_51_18]OGS28594.1 MAG: tryptophan--tRNA ligase [Elusimicrobia bacterium RIFOXYA2_FULL_53_38]
MNSKKVILTGDRPTGPLHIGHYVGSLRKRVALQHEYRQYVLIADMQALTDNAGNPKKVRDNVLEVALDYLAVGLDPLQNTIVIQSLVPELAELTMYYLNLVTLARLQRNPTVKDEMKQKGFANNVPAGFLTYPVSQAADITAFKTKYVPVGEDQLPMIEQTNEIVDKFNSLYGGEILLRCEPLLSDVTRLPGTDGQGKMGKSTDNAIFLKETQKSLREKVRMMYTDPLHIKASDPGHLEGNTVFDYLDAFDLDKIGLEEIKAHYRKGGLGDSKVKERLFSILDQELLPIRIKRQEFEKDLGEVTAMLKKGSEAAREVAGQTLSEVRKALLLDY